MKKIALGIFALCSFAVTAWAQVKIGYEISFKEPQAHYAEVEMNLSGLTKDYVDVKMPVWAPGSYLVREFSKNVEDFKAVSGSKTLKLEKTKKNTWRIYNGNEKSVKINYRVYGNEVSVRTPFIDDSHAFLSSTGIFMYPDQLLSSPSTVKIIPFKGWTKVSTGLPAVPGQEFTYIAKDFDILFDSPIEVGNQEVFEFMASGVKHEMAMYGGGNYDIKRLQKDLPKVIDKITAVYGENPNKNYTFIVHNFSSGGGGLEHLNSTVLGASRDQYKDEEGYLGFLSLVAHEYHHLWNVKRLRPVALGPFDYENENYTTDLWIAEGFTAYYENKFMLRAGFWKLENFIGVLTNNVSSVMNTPGAKVQSAAEASFDSWIKQYRPNENSNNTSVSYYSKGEVVGLLMDLEIAHATKGKSSLDDVMKAMYLQCKATGKGYTDSEFKAMVEKISGISFTDFWAKYVNGTHPVEYAKYFGYAGIKLEDQNAGKPIPYLGISSKRSALGVAVASVSRGSAAWVDGLNVNDDVISVDGVAPQGPVERMPEIVNKKVGDVVKIKISRDGIEKMISVTLKTTPNVSLVPLMDKNVNDEQLAVLKKWLGV
ncbi:M61 family metallopeptidase [Pedobacter sp. AW31-3R]|uniref:M61 family metallopeptidase n=1 Tax=Pedobacter sp. AW31-3R TaxID=3445781 RepID=UPI003F9FC89D